MSSMALKNAQETKVKLWSILSWMDSDCYHFYHIDVYTKRIHGNDTSNRRSLVVCRIHCIRYTYADSQTIPWRIYFGCHQFIPWRHQFIPWNSKNFEFSKEQLSSEIVSFCFPEMKVTPGQCPVICFTSLMRSFK